MFRCIILYLCLSTSLVFSQANLWGVCTHSDFTNEATSMAYDANNNLYVAGYITGETAFNANVTFNSALGNGDIFVAKYGTNGGLSWVKKFGGSMMDRAYGIAVDNAGNVLVSGEFFGSVDFGSYNVQSVNNSKDIFLVKLNPQGNVLWARSEGGPLGDNMYGIAVDSDDNVILTGQFAGTAGIAGQTLVSMTNPTLNAPSYDIFVSKYNSSGTPLWAKHGAAKYEDRGMAVGTDAQNNIYIVGQYSDTLQFAGQTFNNGGYNVGFLAKMNPNGTIQWFNKMSAGLVLPYDLVVGEDNQVTVCGDYLGTLIHQATNGSHTLTHNYSKKIFAASVNSSGQVLWQRAMGSANEISARAITRNNNGSIYISGHFKCSLTELQQSNTGLFNSVGFRDIYLWTLNEQGDVISTKQMGGKKDDYAYDIKVNNSGQPYICGSFMNPLNIPTSTGVNVNSNNDNSFNLNQSQSWSWNGYNLNGDESPNSFVTGALNPATNPYNYFYSQPTDSLYGFIANTDGVQLDTFVFCDNGIIKYEPNTYGNSGPGYNFQWNTSQTTQSIPVTTSGLYFVNVQRWDACSSFSDSAVILVHITPNTPLLSDNLFQYID